MKTDIKTEVKRQRHRRGPGEGPDWRQTARLVRGRKEYWRTMIVGAMDFFGVVLYCLLSYVKWSKFIIIPVVWFDIFSLSIIKLSQLFHEPMKLSKIDASIFYILDYLTAGL